MDKDIEKITALIEDEEVEDFQLTQAIADEIRAMSKAGKVPFYPEVERNKITIISPEGWDVLHLGIYPPKIAILSDGRRYFWGAKEFDMYDPDIFNQIHKLCEEEYTKKKRRSPGRYRLPRG